MTKEWKIDNHLFFRDKQARFRFIDWIRNQFKQVHKGFSESEAKDIIAGNMKEEYGKMYMTECTNALEIYLERLKDVKIDKPEPVPPSFIKTGDWRVGQRIIFKKDIQKGKETGKFRDKFMKFMKEIENKKIKGIPPERMKEGIIYAMQHQYDVDMWEAETAYHIYSTYLKPLPDRKINISKLKKDYQNEQTRKWQEQPVEDEWSIFS